MLRPAFRVPQGCPSWRPGGARNHAGAGRETSRFRSAQVRSRVTEVRNGVSLFCTARPSAFRKVARHGALGVPVVTPAPGVRHLASGAHKCGLGSPKCGMGSASHALPEPTAFRKVARHGALKVPGTAPAPDMRHLASGAHKCGIGSPKCGMGSASHPPAEPTAFRKVVHHAALKVPGITSAPDVSHLASGAHKCGIGSHTSNSWPAPSLPLETGSYSCRVRCRGRPHFPLLSFRTDRNSSQRCGMGSLKCGMGSGLSHPDVPLDKCASSFDAAHRSGGQENA